MTLMRGLKIFAWEFGHRGRAEGLACCRRAHGVRMLQIIFKKDERKGRSHTKHYDVIPFSS